MLKKLLTTFIVLAATATAWAEGWKVTYDTNNCHDAYISKTADGTMTLADAITEVNNLVNEYAAIKTVQKVIISAEEMAAEEVAVLASIKQNHVDLSSAKGINDFASLMNNENVKYVILPDGMTKEQVNAVGTSFDAAVSKKEATKTEAKWVYTYNGEEFIYEGTPTTTDGVSTANVKVLVDLTETKFSYTLWGQPYNGTVFFDPQGNCYGVQNADDVFALTKIKQGYTYNDNGIKVYTGATRTDAKGKIYGNTGEMLPLTTTTTAPWTYEYGRYIYEGEYISGTNGNVGGTFYELKKVTATAENPVYTYDNDNKLHIGEVTESGDQYNKTYTATIGNQIITVYPKTSGDYYYYTKDGENHIYRVEWGKIIYTKLDGTGQYACEGGTIVYNVAQASENVKYYTDNGKKVVYTGNVYTDNDNKEYGVKDIYADKELTYGDIYFNGENIYTGYRNADNTMGCNNPQLLTTSFTYTYTNPNNGETVEFTDARHLTTKEVDYTATVEQKEMEIATGKVHLTAYVSKPGSLKFALARWTVLGNNNAYAAQVGNVTALTISGDVNFTDIGNEGNTISEYGHVAYWDNSSKTDVKPTEKGHADNIINASPAMNGNALTYIDLEDAVFAVQTDMQFAKVNANIKTVILPTAESMTLIPDNAFNNMHYISDLCIPYNYEVIGSGAFFNTHSLMHIYTTDNPEDDSDNEAIVDNGPNTYTFSANLKQIEGGAANLGGPGATFFGSNIEKVTDIYVLAKTAPLCGASAFASSMAYGNNGFAGDLAHPIGRHNYKNGDKWFVVLHYPSELEGTDEEKNYTDVTRVYTLEDETGAVDGRGHAMMWPKHVEFGQAYRTALDGKLWDGTTTYDTQYQGWHEIVLTGNSLARDYDPQTENTEFVYRDWLTICVPYDLKKSQVLSLLGVDPKQNANEEPGVIYEYVCSRDANGNPIKDSEGNYTFEYKEIKQTKVPLYPDVRALTHVSRSVGNRKMTLHFTKLIEQSEVNLLSEDDSNATVKTHNVTINDTHGQGFTKSELTDDDPVVMKGGHPYLIRAYVPKAWDDKIKNLGMYIMSAASSANHAATEKGVEENELPYQYGACTVQAGSVEMYLPCLKHKVHAFDADAKDDINSVVAKDQHTSFSYTDTSMDDPILYHFIGTYASTNIPQYAYYIGKTKDGVHKFSRTTKTTYTWAPYTAVIVGLSLPTYDTEHFGDKATGSAGSISNIIVKPGVKGDDLKIYVGEDEKLASSGARLSLGGFSDSTITGIIEIETDTVVRINDNKVYSINGQYMGTSLNNLPKGIYIINGQKKVVK